MAAPELTATTVRYLFASKWAPADKSGRSLAVPGATVPGLETAANLLEIAVWSLREQALLTVEQIRPVESTKVTVMGGQSFSRLKVVKPSVHPPGLEGALLDAWRGSNGQKGLRGLDEAFAELLSRDDSDGLRSVVLALDLDSKAPWASVGAHCLAEAVEAGILEVKGRGVSKKMSVADGDALEALDGRDEEIAAAREAYRRHEPDLDSAVIGDCMAALHWAHSGSPD